MSEKSVPLVAVVRGGNNSGRVLRCRRRTVAVERVACLIDSERGAQFFHILCAWVDGSLSKWKNAELDAVADSFIRREEITDWRITHVDLLPLVLSNGGAFFVDCNTVDNISIFNDTNGDPTKAPVEIWHQSPSHNSVTNTHSPPSPSSSERQSQPQISPPPYAQPLNMRLL